VKGQIMKNVIVCSPTLLATPPAAALGMMDTGNMKVRQQAM
jgi:hypothetical protein